MKRNMCAVYMDEKIYDVFRVYAVKKAPRKAYEVWADALTSYMENNPIEGLTLMIQRVESQLPNKIDEVKIKVLTPQIVALVEKIKDAKKDDFPELRENLAKLIRKGLRVKHLSEEFVILLEEATKHI